MSVLQTIVWTIAVLRMSLALTDGQGVCTRIEMRNVTRAVASEEVVGTTVVPCISNSWLEELYCMNSPVKTENVTKVVFRPVVETVRHLVKYCCPGYFLFGNQCIKLTTPRTTTVPTTTLHVETTQTSTELTTTKRETTQASTKLTTTKRETTQASTKLTTTKRETTQASTKLTTTKRETTQASTKLTTTKRETTQPSTKLTTTKRETTQASTKLTTTKRETTQPSTKLTTTNQETTTSTEMPTTEKKTTHLETTSTDKTTTERETTTSYDTTFDHTSKHQPSTASTTEETKLFTDADKKADTKRTHDEEPTKSYLTITDAAAGEIKEKVERTGATGLDTKDILLYIATGCGMLSLVTTIVGVCFCYRSRRKRGSGTHGVDLGMDTIRINGINHLISQPGTSCNGQRIEQRPLPGTVMVVNETECTDLCPLNDCSADHYTSLDTVTRPPNQERGLFATTGQNWQNEYTELRLSNCNQTGATGSPKYDDFLGIEEDDPYEKLPDWDDVATCKTKVYTK